jgi:hypothetical protein
VTCQPAVVCAAGVAQRSVTRQPSAKQLATEYTLRDGEGRRGLLRAAAMTSHGSTLVSKLTPVNTVTQHNSRRSYD